MYGGTNYCPELYVLLEVTRSHNMSCVDVLSEGSDVDVHDDDDE